MDETSSPDTDPVIAALDNLVEAMTQNAEAIEMAVEQARVIKELRAKGLAHGDIAHETGAPLVVQLVTENLERLRIHGAQLRKAHAAALHEEGLTMDQIAKLFGVSRQRISALLRSGPEAEVSSPPHLGPGPG